MLTSNLCVKSRDGRSKKLGEVEIVNVTRCAGRVSQDYYWRVTEIRPDGSRRAVTGAVCDSYNGSGMECLAEVLNRWLRGGMAVDQHGNQRSTAENMTLTPEAYWQKHDKHRAAS